MELTFFVRLKQPPQGLNHARLVAGKTAAKNWEKLGAVALKIGVKPLQNFVSIGKPELNALLAKAANSAVKLAPGDRWFLASEALASVRARISSVSRDPKTFESARQLIQDLQRYEDILRSAEARQSRFHFSPDF